MLRLASFGTAKTLSDDRSARADLVRKGKKTAGAVGSHHSSSGDTLLVRLRSPADPSHVVRQNLAALHRASIATLLIPGGRLIPLYPAPSVPDAVVFSIFGMEHRLTEHRHRTLPLHFFGGDGYDKYQANAARRSRGTSLRMEPRKQRKSAYDRHMGVKYALAAGNTDIPADHKAFGIVMRQPSGPDRAAESSI